MSKIENLRDLINEFHKCSNSFPYFCKNYVNVEDKEEKICRYCELYEYCLE